MNEVLYQSPAVYFGQYFIPITLMNCSTQKQNNVCWIRVLIQRQIYGLFFFTVHSHNLSIKSKNIQFYNIWPQHI